MPLLVAEPTSPACRRFWDDSDAIVSCRLSHVEAAAALAQARRLGRLTTKEHAGSLTRLDDLWDQINVVEVDDMLIRHAEGLAAQFGLRGYDAVHCACAEQLTDQDLVAATGDRQLLAAWNGLGVATFDPTASDK